MQTVGTLEIAFKASALGAFQRSLLGVRNFSQRVKAHGHGGYAVIQASGDDELYGTQEVMVMTFDPQRDFTAVLPFGGTEAARASFGFPCLKVVNWSAVSLARRLQRFAGPISLTTPAIRNVEGGTLVFNPFARPVDLRTGIPSIVFGSGTHLLDTNFEQGGLGPGLPTLDWFYFERAPMKIIGKLYRSENDTFGNFSAAGGGFFSQRLNLGGDTYPIREFALEFVIFTPSAQASLTITADDFAGTGTDLIEAVTVYAGALTEADYDDAACLNEFVAVKWPIQYALQGSTPRRVWNVMVRLKQHIDVSNPTFRFIKRARGMLCVDSQYCIAALL